mmetsp:Transcript_16233/g.31427  ORF Transcript_16233/g.31427 Transcript_16233/m.31427 type:complete len:386 (+) Transcript_16233:198-1355(+)
MARPPKPENVAANEFKVIIFAAVFRAMRENGYVDWNKVKKFLKDSKVLGNIPIPSTKSMRGWLDSYRNRNEHAFRKELNQFLSTRDDKVQLQKFLESMGQENFSLLESCPEWLANRNTKFKRKFSVDSDSVGNTDASAPKRINLGNFVKSYISALDPMDCNLFIDGANIQNGVHDPLFIVQIYNHVKNTSGNYILDVVKPALKIDFKSVEIQMLAFELHWRHNSQNIALMKFCETLNIINFDLNPYNTYNSLRRLFINSYEAFNKNYDAPATITLVNIYRGIYLSSTCPDDANFSHKLKLMALMTNLQCNPHSRNSMNLSNMIAIRPRAKYTHSFIDKLEKLTRMRLVKYRDNKNVPAFLREESTIKNALTQVQVSFDKFRRATI